MQRRHLNLIIKIVSFTLLFFLLPSIDSPLADVKRTREEARKKYSMKTLPYTPKVYPDHGQRDYLKPQGRRARAFYLTPYFLRVHGPKKIARIMKKAHLNAVVFDIKDDFGQILYPSKIPLTEGLQLKLIKNPKKLIEIFHQYGIYVIGRLVSFKDSKLVYKRPDLSVRYRPGRRLFWAGTGWLDAYSAEVRDYLIDIAREWESFGIDEIQLDYIRFPKGLSATWGIWLHEANDGRKRDKLIASFLERIDRALKIPLSVDIYGLTTLVDGDPRDLGQTIEKMAKHVEAISPMMYANGMNSYFPKRTITPAVYGIIQCGIWRARQKAPHIALRPYLQAYPDSVPFFSEQFIMKQLDVAEKAGADGFIFWNSSMRNQIAYNALRKMGRLRMKRYGSSPGQYIHMKKLDWCAKPGSGDVFGPNRASKKEKQSK